MSNTDGWADLKEIVTTEGSSTSVVDEVAAKAIATAAATRPVTSVSAEGLIAKHDDFIGQVYDFAIQEIEKAEERLAVLKARIEEERKLTTEKGRHFISMINGTLTAVNGAHTFIESLESSLEANK